MKKLISIFFILALSGTFLPAVISYEHKKIALFSTVEEEQPDGTKEVKEKETAKAVFENSLYSVTGYQTQSLYHNLFILFYRRSLPWQSHPAAQLFLLIL